MKNYKRLDFNEREEISRMLAQNCSLNSIAKKLDRHVSAISREIRAGKSFNSGKNLSSLIKQEDKN